MTVDIPHTGTSRASRIDKMLAKLPEVQEVVKGHAELAAERARMNLAAHRISGDSKVYLEHGKVDWHVGISDERGQKAAAAIEFGSWRSRGTYVLHRAFNMGGKA